jgi:hypothetical protein
MAGTDPVSLDCFGLKLPERKKPEFERKNRQALSYITYASAYGLGDQRFETRKI